ncbi:MAG: Ig-like domain-containing protein [Sedimentisphaerales bacterium]
MLILLLLSSVGCARELRLLRAKPDPYGYPRPAPGEKNVPVATSFFLQIGFGDKNADDTVLPDSISLRIGPHGESPVEILKPGQQFADGYWGKVFEGKGQGPTMAVYIDGKIDLKPSTTYVVSVSARSKGGAVLGGKQGTWEFTTEDAAATHRLQFEADLSNSPVHWHGGFFTGFCKPSFCTSAANRIPGYELMDSLRKRYPKAWSLQRDFTMTGMERQPRFLSGNPPNVVRERETRRIIAMDKHDEGILLRVEDFFGHEQYGIASNRPLSEDYHPGDEVLIADGVSDAKAQVLAVVGDDAGVKSVLVTSFKTPADGWKIEYSQPLPEKENPDAPGLFPPGGCYLTKLRPAGTPHYYWGRLDKEWDIAHRQFGRRLVVNFAEAPGDCSIDGQNWTFPKDYAEYHEVVRAYTEHLIDRYGDACLDFYPRLLAPSGSTAPARRTFRPPPRAFMIY